MKSFISHDHRDDIYEDASTGRKVFSGKLMMKKLIKDNPFAMKRL